MVETCPAAVRTFARRDGACAHRRLRSRSRPATPGTPTSRRRRRRSSWRSRVQQPATLYLELTGNTAPFNSVDLVARVQGYLNSIDYKDGALVAKGAQLFGIERDQYQAQLDQAKASLANRRGQQAYNQAEYSGRRRSAKQDFATQATVQQWKSKADQSAASILNAKAAIEPANINLGYTKVHARRSTASSPIILSTWARSSASAGRRSSRRSCRPTRCTSIST